MTRKEAYAAMKYYEGLDAYLSATTDLCRALMGQCQAMDRDSAAVIATSAASLQRRLRTLADIASRTEAAATLVFNRKNGTN